MRAMVVVGSARMIRAFVLIMSLSLSGCFSYAIIPASQLGVVQQWCGVPPDQQEGFKITTKTKIKHYYDEWESLCEATYLPTSGTIRLRNPDVGLTVGAVLAAAAFGSAPWMLAASLRSIW